MAEPKWAGIYDTGTASVEQGSTIVTLHAAGAVQNAVVPGDRFGGHVGAGVRIEAVSATELLLAFPWTGPTQTEAPYEIILTPYQSGWRQAVNDLLQQLDASPIGAFADLTGEADTVPAFATANSMKLVHLSELVNGVRFNIQVNTLAGRDFYDNEAVGFAVLVANVGDGRAAVYTRVGDPGNWTAPAYVTGPSITLDVTEVDEVPYGVPPDVELTSVAGGYNLKFEIPAGMIIVPGTTTTLAPGAQATVDFVPVTGGYRLDIGLPKGDTGDIDGVTPFWVTRLSQDANADAALEGLGATSVGRSVFTAANEAAARTSIGANNAANLSSGTLPDARVSNSLTPDKAFRRGNIVGPVSQSGGVPTGAIIERGSNESGQYVRFADGTQICWNSRYFPSVAMTGMSGAIYYAPNDSARPFPAAFVAPPDFAMIYLTSGVAVWSASAGVATATAWNAWYPFTEVSRPNIGINALYYAIGRWF